MNNNDWSGGRDMLSIRTRLRQHFMVGVLGSLAWFLAPLGMTQSIDDITLNVYKDESCGCCVGWIEHMDANGYESTVYHPNNLNAVKAQLGLKPEWISCHTAVTESGYVFEGHIPEKFIDQFLADPPQEALGLSVPGMPIGGPGMEMGNRFTPYDILLLMKDGSSSVYASIQRPDQQY